MQYSQNFAEMASFHNFVNKIEDTKVVSGWIELDGSATIMTENSRSFVLYPEGKFYVLEETRNEFYNHDVKKFMSRTTTLCAYKNKRVILSFKKYLNDISFPEKLIRAEKVKQK